MQKKLSSNEVLAFTELKETFDQPIQEVRQALDVCDSDCPNLHFTKYAQLIADLQKESDDDPEHVCCSYECLYQRKNYRRLAGCTVK